MDILPTKTELRQTLSGRGVMPRRKLGQNFLVDHNMLRLIARKAELSRSDLVLEVGAGPGHFTGLLAKSAGHVIAVELDPRLADICREHLADAVNAEVVSADILSGKSALNPEVLALCRGLHGTCGLVSLKMVSNLPYSVATPTVLNLLESDLKFDFLLVLVQAEIAGKFAATENSPDYGVVGILVQLAADVEIVRRVPKQLFWPEPEVESALVKIVPRREPMLPEPRLPGFREFVRLLFSQRRKTILKLLSQTGASEMLKPSLRGRKKIEEVLKGLGLAGNARAQELSVKKLVELYIKSTEYRVPSTE